MHSPETYRAEAENCVRQAEQAKSPEHRIILLTQAQTLLRMAEQARIEIINKRLAGEGYLDKAS
jgi:hypothetical protein